jgi:hypothetical protein
MVEPINETIKSYAYVPEDLSSVVDLMEDVRKNTKRTWRVSQLLPLKMVVDQSAMPQNKFIGVRARMFATSSFGQGILIGR